LIEWLPNDELPALPRTMEPCPKCNLIRHVTIILSCTTCSNPAINSEVLADIDLVALYFGIENHGLTKSTNECPEVNGFLQEIDNVVMPGPPLADGPPDCRKILQLGLTV